MHILAFLLGFFLVLFLFLGMLINERPSLKLMLSHCRRANILTQTPGKAYRWGGDRFLGAGQLLEKGDAPPVVPEIGDAHDRSNGKA